MLVVVRFFTDLSETFLSFLDAFFFAAICSSLEIWKAASRRGRQRGTTPATCYSIQALWMVRFLTLFNGTFLSFFGEFFFEAISFSFENRKAACRRGHQQAS
jgi:hypothetical protein